MPNTNPVRLQLSRVKGARLISPNGLPVVSVARPSRWGNSWSVRRQGAVWLVSSPDRVAEFSHELQRDAWSQCVALYRAALLAGELDVTLEEIRKELAGKNLACWCRLDQPCHADVLLCVARGVYS